MALADAIADLRLCWFDETNQQWVPDDNTVVDANAGTIQATLTHFSVYGVFSGAAFAAAAVNLDNVNIYPNPYIPNDGDPGTGIPYSGPTNSSGIYMNGLVPGTVIEVYDLRGRLVDEMTVPAGTGAVQWDVRNSAGEEVASGVYIVVFKDGGSIQTKKLFIVR